MSDVGALERELVSELRVRMRDCDVHGHLHNTRYVDYVLDARDDQLRTYGLDLLEFGHRTGLSWFVTMNQVRFYEPAKIGALLRVVTRLTSYDEHRLHVEGRVYGSEERLCALVWCTFRVIDLSTGAPAEHNDELMQLFRRAVLPLPSAPTFEERARSIER